MSASWTVSRRHVNAGKKVKMFIVSQEYVLCMFAITCPDVLLLRSVSVGNLWCDMKGNSLSSTAGVSRAGSSEVKKKRKKRKKCSGHGVSSLHWDWSKLLKENLSYGQFSAKPRPLRRHFDWWKLCFLTNHAHLWTWIIALPFTVNVFVLAFCIMFFHLQHNLVVVFVLDFCRCFWIGIYRHY